MLVLLFSVTNSFLFPSPCDTRSGLSSFQDSLISHHQLAPATQTNDQQSIFSIAW